MAPPPEPPALTPVEPTNPHWCGQAGAGVQGEGRAFAPPPSARPCYARPIDGGATPAHAQEALALVKRTTLHAAHWVATTSSRCKDRDCALSGPGQDGGSVAVLEVIAHRAIR